MTNYFAGIGSRTITDDIADDMFHLAKFAVVKHWILRSGGAEGADSAFEQGCDYVNGKKEIFLPWKGFNGNPSPLFPPSDEAFTLARLIHPTYHSLTNPVKSLLARNMHQILGEDLNTPVRCVICWTKDGCISHTTYSQHTGGTGSAIALASKRHIPIFNLYHSDHFDKALDFLDNPDECETIQL